VFSLIYPRWITVDQVNVVPTLSTTFEFQFCINFTSPVQYRALVFSPQSYPGASIPVFLTMSVLNPASQLLCKNSANSQVACIFTMGLKGIYKMIVDPLHSDHYKLSVNVEAIKQADETELALQRRHGHETINLSKLSLGDATRLYQIFETSLGEEAVDQDEMIQVSFQFCNDVEGFGFVVEGRSETTQVQPFMCSPELSPFDCISNPIAREDTTAQTQIISTSSKLAANASYYLLIIGRGYELNPPSTLNYITISSQN